MNKCLRCEESITEGEFLDNCGLCNKCARAQPLEEEVVDALSGMASEAQGEGNNCIDVSSDSKLLRISRFLDGMCH